MKPHYYSFTSLLVIATYLSATFGMGKLTYYVDDTSSLIAMNLPALPIVLDSPKDEVFWDAGVDDLNFTWTTTGGYSGNYELKILELDPSDPVPPVLPGLGLFHLESGISGAAFLYLSSMPPFVYGKKYAWQVEGTDLGGELSTPVVFFPNPKSSCTLSVIGIPTGTLCPGECFTLTGPVDPVSLDNAHSIIAYSDNPSFVEVDGLPAYPASQLDNASLETPAHYNGSGSTYSIEVCIAPGAVSPVAISLYFYRPPSGTDCAATPLAAPCCHDVQTFSVSMANVLDYTDLQVAIKDPTATSLVTEVCSGNPVHFSIQNLPAKAPVEWQCSIDNGVNWLPISSFSQCNFVTLPNDPSLTMDCATSTDGFLDKIFRAKFTVTPTGGGAPCEYFTTEYPLRICCPITTGAVSVSTTDPAFDLSIGLCEGDVVPVDVLLTTGDLFVNPPGTYVDIKWRLGLASLAFDDQTSLSTSVTVGAVDLCFHADVTNCAGKTKTFTKCISVDPKPICGFIQGITPSNLTATACLGEPVEVTDCYTIPLINLFWKIEIINKRHYTRSVLSNYPKTI